MSGLFDTDGDVDDESVNDEVEHDDNVTDKDSDVLCDNIPETVVLAHADNREETEAENDSNALLVEDTDRAGECDADRELLDDNDL